MKTWYSAICMVIVTIILVALFTIGLQNLPIYLKLIPWTSIGITFGIVLLLWFFVDCAYVISKYGLKSFPMVSRWALFFESIGLFLMKFENNMLVLGILLLIFIVSNLYIGCNVAYQTVANGFNKAINYDTAVSTLRSKYQDQVIKSTNDYNDLKIKDDKKDQEIQDLKDQQFLMDQEMQKLQVEVKQLLPKGAKKSFR